VRLSIFSLTVVRLIYSQVKLWGGLAEHGLTPVHIKQLHTYSKFVPSS
jgi:hypothetical protein